MRKQPSQAQDLRQKVQNRSEMEFQRQMSLRRQNPVPAKLSKGTVQKMQQGMLKTVNDAIKAKQRKAMMDKMA